MTQRPTSNSRKEQATFYSPEFITEERHVVGRQETYRFKATHESAAILHIPAVYIACGSATGTWIISTVIQGIVNKGLL